MALERRKSNRCTISGDLFHVFFHKSKMLGKIMDISIGGLKYEKSPDVEEDFDQALIDIVCRDINRFHLEGIPCRKIYDMLTLSEGRSFSGAEIWCRGIEFVDLTRVQKNTLKALLNLPACIPEDPGEELLDIPSLGGPKFHNSSS